MRLENWSSLAVGQAPRAGRSSRAPLNPRPPLAAALMSAGLVLPGGAVGGGALLFALPAGTSAAPGMYWAARLSPGPRPAPEQAP